MFSGSIKTKIYDQGVGIDLQGKGDTLFKIFTFNECSLNNVLSLSSGIGLGLNTAWALAEFLGGKISLQSKIGKNHGTVVSFKVLTTDAANQS